MSVNSCLIVKGTSGTRSMEVVITLLRYVFLANVAHSSTAICADHLIATIFFDQFDFTLWTSPHHRLTPGFFHVVSCTKSFIFFDLLASFGQMRSFFALATGDKTAVRVLAVEDTVHFHRLAYGLEIAEWAHLETLDVGQGYLRLLLIECQLVEKL